MGCTEASRGHRGFGYSEVTTGLSSGAIGCSVPEGRLLGLDRTRTWPRDRKIPADSPVA